MTDNNATPPVHDLEKIGYVQLGLNGADDQIALAFCCPPGINLAEAQIRWCDGHLFLWEQTGQKQGEGKWWRLDTHDVTADTLTLLPLPEGQSSDSVHIAPQAFRRYTLPVPQNSELSR